MDYTLVAYSFAIILKTSVVIVGVCVCASIIAGIVRVSTQIDDAVISYAFKLIAVFALLYFVGGMFVEQLVSYTNGIWGAASSYV